MTAHDRAEVTLDLTIGADSSLGFAIDCNGQSYSVNRRDGEWLLQYHGPQQCRDKLPGLAQRKVSSWIGAARIDWTEALKRALVNIRKHQEES